MASKRNYLDNAATSWPKPESVYLAVDQYQREVGVAAGRGSYRHAEEVGRVLSRLRGNLAKLINARSAKECVFTFSCTDSLNMALQGILQPGDHVITSAAEHNSILRPLRSLEQQGISVTTLPIEDGTIVAEELSAALLPQTKIVALTHASNVTGARQPIEQVAEIISRHDALFLLDAAQTLGHESIDVQALPVDMLAAPGHKGLLGPLGTGLLYVREELAQRIRPLRRGGTGTQSELMEQPSELPVKFESGNQNVIGLVGLDAGVQYVMENGLADSNHLLNLSTKLLEMLAEVGGATVYSQPNRCGIVSFNVDIFDPRELAVALDSMATIQVRAGLHCAPLMHQALGAFDLGGTVRASFGHFSTTESVDQLMEALRMLTS